MGEVQRIVQQAAAGDGPRRALVTRTRELLAMRYSEATIELENPLLLRARQLENGNAAQRQQLVQLQKTIADGAKECNSAKKMIVNVAALQAAAEKIDRRVRILEQLRSGL